MKISDIPVKFFVAFASGAGASFVTDPIPVTTGIAGRASLTSGFPELTFQQLAAGGNPPWGTDMNGILRMVTAWLRFAQAGGIPVVYDAAFSAQVSGYPQGALLQSATLGHFWISAIDDNPSDPDTAGANWIEFPDALIQIQGGNYAVDSGAVNHVVLTLAPVPASLVSIVGSPIRYTINHPNTITTPDININGLGAVTQINSDGSAIVIGQFSRTGQLVEGYLTSPSVFQVTSPGKPVSAGGGGVLPPGAIVLWPNDVPPGWGLECNGAIENIPDYPGLFNIIGNKYGGDGIDTFARPDLRGEFVRGWDHGRGLDPNASTRTNRGDGTTGDHVGTNQGWANGTITASQIDINFPVVYEGASKTGGRYVYVWHAGLDTANYVGGPTSGQIGFVAPYANFDITQWPVGYSNVSPFDLQTGSYVVQTLGGSGTIVSGAETRPVNINMMYIIAF